MATSQRDVKLRVSVETSGEEQLQQLAGDVRDVGAAASASAPGVDRLTRLLEGLASATVSKREAERAARAEEVAARAELDARRDAYARTRAGADAATRATVEHQAAVRAERLAIVEAGIALRERRAALAATTREAQAAALAERRLAEQLAATMRTQVTGNAAVGNSLESLRGQYTLLRNAATSALGGTLVGGLARDVAATADAYANLGARIKLVTGEGQAFGTALQGVQDIAQRTGGTLESTGTLFASIVQAGKESNLAQADALALTESIGQAVQLSGVSAQASDAAITQLIQGLQSGVLRGEEFNSIMEQSPRLAQALAAPTAMPSTGRTVTINLMGRGSTNVRVTSDADAAKVEAVLRQLETVMGRTAP